MSLFKQVLALMALTAFVFCKQGPGTTPSALSVKKVDSNTPVGNAPRDYSITSRNSFNDLFFDSLRLEEFLKRQNANEEIVGAMRSFYNVRNYEYAWFSSKGLIEQSFNFRSLYSTSSPHDFLDLKLERELDRLRVGLQQPVNARDPATLLTELQITQTFIRYALINYAKMGVSAAALGTYIPAQKRTTLGYADFVLAQNPVNDHYALINQAYRLLKIYLKQYSDIAKKGGWPLIPPTAKTIKKGSSDGLISVVKQRLHVSAELDISAIGPTFDSGLENAFMHYQRLH